MSDPLIAAMGQPPKLANLRRSPRPPAPPDDVEQAPPPAAPAVSGPKTEHHGAPRQRRTRPAGAATPSTRPVGRPATGRVSVSIGLPVPLVEPMAAAAEQARQSYGDWLMAALNDVWDRLDDVYPPLPKVRPELPPPRRTPRAVVPGGRQTVNFRLTAEQVAAVDARQQQLQVESRSEFVTTIVELALGT